MFRVDLTFKVRVAEAVSVTTALEDQVTSPEVLEEDAAEARKVTSRAVSSVCNVLAEMFELVAVANQIPVVPKKNPVASVEPLTTVNDSA